MLFSRGAGALCLYRNTCFSPSFAPRYLATKSYDPLRILFCGSDEFSIASLEALHNEYLVRPDLISSIDVVCRPGKKVGRGLKTIREVPIKATATALSLPIHEIDTFTGWEPPISPEGPINLIVAVSFGLFVPPRILNGAKYGGLNVHPSLLPDFRGPAPLHHTLMAGRTHTGVTLQTLHPKHFDHGTILAQTLPPALKIPNPESCTVPELLKVVAPKGAAILVQGIKRGLFVPPLKEAGWRSSEDPRNLIHAAKIKPEDRHIDWRNWTWTDINRRSRVIGPLWSKSLVINESSSNGSSFQLKRIIFSDIEEAPPLEGSQMFAAVPGLPFIDHAHPVQPDSEKGVYVFTRDGKMIRIHQMKVEGEQNADALRAALKARMVGDKTYHSDDARFTPFHSTLC